MFDTTQPSQVTGLNGYTVDPIFTVGDKIGNYVPPGILDGIGAFSLNDTTVRLYVNHELSNSATSPSGYKYTLKNGTQLSGARVSFFDVDKRTFQITNSGLAYDKIINRAGNEVKAATDLENAGLTRFCSASLFEANQFGAGIGLADRIFFTGEEGGTSSEFALDTKTNTLYALPWFGRAGFENVAELNTGRTDKVAFMIGDDRGVGAPIIIYVGDKVANGNFLERNGLVNGKLYAWVADDPADATDKIELDPREFAGANKSLKGKFVEIKQFDAASKGANGYDAQGFATQAKQDELYKAAQAFLFARPEDVTTNPKNGTQAAFNATGNSTLFGGTAAAPGPETWGTTYKVDFKFTDLTKGDITANVTILNDGNETKDLGLRSPDNIDWADDGKIYLQEDPAFSGFGATSKLVNSIFSIDPSAADPSKTLTRVAIADRLALPATQTDAQPTDLGNWETSGILDVSTLFGNQPGQVLVFDVQAHSLVDGTIITATNIDGNGDGKITAAENLVEGGQLSFLIAPAAKLVQSTSLFAGTTAGDTVDAGITKGFDGINDVVFTGGGDDKVDVIVGGALAGSNRIDAGSGKDTIDIANNDRAFGGVGDDILDATDATGYRASGGAGNDTFYLGTNGRALGGDGNDKFFVGTGGGNTLSGGAGVDAFWIYNGEAPASSNTILDFQVGTDVIGIQGAGAAFKFADLVRTGNNIALGGTTIATLTGIDTSTLTSANFVIQ